MLLVCATSACVGWVGEIGHNMKGKTTMSKSDWKRFLYCWVMLGCLTLSVFLGYAETPILRTARGTYVVEMKWLELGYPADRPVDSVADAEAVRAIGLRNYDLLLKGTDGSIHFQDRNDRYSDPYHATLNILWSRLREVGHVTGHYDLRIGNVVICMGTCYAVTREDIDSYPERVRAACEAELQQVK